MRHCNATQYGKCPACFCRMLAYFQHFIVLMITQIMFGFQFTMKSAVTVTYKYRHDNKYQQYNQIAVHQRHRTTFYIQLYAENPSQPESN